MGQIKGIKKRQLRKGGKVTSLYLDDGTAKIVEAMAKKARMSRSEFITKCIHVAARYIGGETKGPMEYTGEPTEEEWIPQSDWDVL